MSNLKPIRGLDPDAYENLASFCRQDYPDYELVLCVDQGDEAILPMVERLQRDFPDRQIRVLFGSGRVATNDKVAKLVRLVSEARHEVVVISDSDVRVGPDYLRTVVAPLADPKVGAVTCFYVPTGVQTFAENLQSVGMMSDFYPGILVAWQLDGVKFALGPTIVTTRSRLAGFGGYENIENRPADDLLVGPPHRRTGVRRRAAALLRFHGRRFQDHRRSAAQAYALDRGDAAHASLGPFRITPHAGSSLVPAGGGGASDRWRSRPVTWEPISCCAWQ